MELLQSGSGSAARLSIKGRRAHDGVGGDVALVTSQQWSFSVGQTTRPVMLSLSQIVTQSGSSTNVQLAPPTIAPAATRGLSLYPETTEEASTSVDAEILSAQRFLRQQHPDLDVPDHLLSHLIHDNAEALEETGHDPDGSLGIADAQAIALLGPIKSPQGHTHAIVCIGGHNRDCLLLHQLVVSDHENDCPSSPRHEHGHWRTSRTDDEPTSAGPTRLQFVPARRPEQCYRTPILQISASADRQLVAVRTFSSTTLLALRHGEEPHGNPRVFLETVHQTHYSSSGNAQQQDFHFHPTIPSLAAAIDRHGNLDIYRFQPEERQTQQPNPTRDLSSPSPSPSDPSESNAKRKPNTFPASPAPASAALSAGISVSVHRVPIDALTQAMNEDDPDASSDNEAEAHKPVTDKTSLKASFGRDDHSVFLFSRHALHHVRLASSGSGPGTETPPFIDTLIRTSLCLSSFKRARLFSIATTATSSDHQLLAVCSSDTIFWFEIEEAVQPLFSTPHHRGDDPTLYLTVLPGTDDNLILFLLSSRRNDVASCYAVRTEPAEGPGDDLLDANASTDSQSPRFKYTLDSAPTLVPPFASSAPAIQERAAPTSYVDAAHILQRGAASGWFAFALDHCGALWSQNLTMPSDSPSDPASSSNADFVLEVLPPSSGMHLYLAYPQDPLPSKSKTDESSFVRTKIVDHRELCRSLFGSRDGGDAARQRNDKVGDYDRDNHQAAARLIDSFDDAHPGSVAPHAAIPSLGQLLGSLDRDADVGKRGLRDFDQTDGGMWSTALHRDGDDGAEEARRRKMLDARSDFRRALPSLGQSAAQAPWSRAATLLSESPSDGSLNQDGHPRHTSSLRDDILERALGQTNAKVHDEVAQYLPNQESAKAWSARGRRALQESIRKAYRAVSLNLALESELFVRPKVRMLDEGAPTQRPQQREGTNWTAFEHQDIYNFVEEQGDTIPPPHIGSVGLSFFAPLRSGDIGGWTPDGGHEKQGSKSRLDEAELEALLPSTSSTARLLLAEWQLGEDPTEYNYMDPFQGLHRLPRASRLRGPTARARSRSFSRASSASTEDRSRSRSRSRKQSAAPSLSQSGVLDSQGPPSSYPPSLVGHSQAASVASQAPPTLVSRRKRQPDATVTRSQPIRASKQAYGPSQSTQPSTMSSRAREASAAAQTQPPRFGLAGSFGDLTPTVSPTSSQVGTPTQSNFGAAATQIEAGRFGARPAKPDRPPKKKKRASGF
ncbi:hypothetical protein PHSY_002724 [Pseudozyma hubeiensis SY62]|uniref:Uncharacterized protein n=1 Tax=Pseudozyma hubeiensis (strain SY62) TaxID=1305764 RepID=R9P1R8_PSEHS|nr:hypothetical protein PHSY_002724 [Pseudozyma hubeiensis SY62]GAC95149.1 hypothetical protein PHSY_002724 [Pseudozyma hubeiensis SY62]